MKRFIYTLGLALGVSVASYAGVITTATGNVAGPGATLIDFESGTTFPLGQYTSLGFNIGGNTVTISASAAASGYNTGNVFAIQSGITGYATGPGGLNGKYLTTYGGTVAGAPPATYTFNGSQARSENFVRTLTFTFATPITDFITGYFGNDSRATPGGAYLATANQVTFGTGAGSVTANLANQGCTAAANNCPTVGSGQIGYQGDVALSSFSVVTFTFTGADQSPFYDGDQVLFDSIRFATGALATTTSSSSSTTVVPGVPEPSTYALIGAGLAGLAFARRKKK